MPELAQEKLEEQAPRPAKSEDEQKVQRRCKKGSDEELKDENGDLLSYFGRSGLSSTYALSGPNFLCSAYSRQRRKTIRKLAITGMERKIPKMPPTSAPAIP